MQSIDDTGDSRVKFSLNGLWYCVAKINHNNFKEYVMNITTVECLHLSYDLGIGCLCSHSLCGRGGGVFFIPQKELTLTQHWWALIWNRFCSRDCRGKMEPHRPPPAIIQLLRHLFHCLIRHSHTYLAAGKEKGCQREQRCPWDLWAGGEQKRERSLPGIRQRWSCPMKND